MKINWKVRLKNPLFWLTIIPATMTFVYTVLALFDVAPVVPQNTATEAGCAIVTALGALGVLVDPTTAGLNDSKQAMEYEAPKKEIIPDGETDGR